MKQAKPVRPRTLGPPSQSQAGPAQDPWPPKPSRSGPGPLAPQSQAGPGQDPKPRTKQRTVVRQSRDSQARNKNVGRQREG